MELLTHFLDVCKLVTRCKYLDSGFNLSNTSNNEVYCRISNEFVYSVEAIFFYRCKKGTKAVWALLNKFTHPCLIDQIDNAGQIDSSTGRIRAWVRFSLNDIYGLSSYLRIIGHNFNEIYRSSSVLANQELLEIFIAQIEGILSHQLPKFNVNSTLLNTIQDNSRIGLLLCQNYSF